MVFLSIKLCICYSFFIRRKSVTNKGAPIRLLADFSTETLQAKRDWHEIFKVMRKKKKDLQARLLYPARISFIIEEEVKSLPALKEKKNKNKKLREYVTTKPVLQKS